MSSRAHAGGYAADRFKRGRASFRARTRWMALAAFGPFFVAGLLVPFLSPPPVVIWIGGLVAGAGIPAWVVVRDSPPEQGEKWRTGAEGERKTAKRLRALEREGWLLAHDIANERGNYDHIALSRAGVFVMDTKCLSGTMQIEDGVPRLTRRYDPEGADPWAGLGPCAKAAAARLSRTLGALGGRPPWVEPAVVLWCDFPAGVQAFDGCTFVQGERLAAWLRSQPAKLSEARLAELRAAVEDLSSRRQRPDSSSERHIGSTARHRGADCLTSDPTQARGPYHRPIPRRHPR